MTAKDIDPINLAGLVPPALEDLIVRAQSSLMATMLAVKRGDLTLAQGLTFTGLDADLWAAAEDALATSAARAQRADPTGAQTIAATLTLAPERGRNKY